MGVIERLSGHHSKLEDDKHLAKAIGRFHRGVNVLVRRYAPEAANGIEQGEYFVPPVIVYNADYKPVSFSGSVVYGANEQIIRSTIKASFRKKGKDREFAYSFDKVTIPSQSYLKRGLELLGMAEREYGRSGLPRNKPLS